MLRTMRENTKWIMLITALAFIGLMVFEWGMDFSGRSSADSFGGEIGRVNGKSVNYEEFLAVHRQLYQQQQQYQQEPITQAQNRELEQAAWDQLVLERLIQEEIRKRGLEATPDEIRQAARFAPPPEFYGYEVFQTDGQFDIAKYQQFLGSSAVDAQTLAQLEAYYRDLISRNKLYQQVVSTAYLSDGELWQLWRDRNERASIRYVAMNPDAMVRDEAVSVTDKEIAAFYQSHRADFQRPANAAIQVVSLPKAPSAADTAAARERALQIRSELQGGADFAEVARRESADGGSAAQGGDLGTFGRGQMVPAFEQAVWEIGLNTISEPVQTSFGFHLIKVTSRTNDQATASHILIPIELGDETLDEILTAVDSLEHLATTTSLPTAAIDLMLNLRSVEITPELPIVAGIGRMDEGADWAFHEAEAGELSPVFETADNFYIFQLNSLTPAGTLTLEEASPGIRDRLLAQKRHQEAIRTGRDLIDEIGRGSFAEMAEAHGLEIQETEPFTRFDFVPGIGQANAVIGAAFGLEPGATSGILEANGLLYIAQGIERIPADRAAFDAAKDEIRAETTAGLQQQRWALYIGSLTESAKIVDNRSKVLVSSGSVAQR
jgi:parvulin-like peptidyl-prolyl isomerase